MGLVICQRKNADESRRGRMASKILVNVRKYYKGVRNCHFMIHILIHPFTFPNVLIRQKHF